MTLDYQRLAGAGARDQGSELMQRVPELAGESGEIADTVKRCYRNHRRARARA